MELFQKSGPHSHAASCSHAMSVSNVSERKDNFAFVFTLIAGRGALPAEGGG